jgi:hypothetical protein
MLRPEIVRYCARDVALLPGLYNVYNAKLRLPGETLWRVQVRGATKDRISALADRDAEMCRTVRHREPFPLRFRGPSEKVAKQRP